MLTTPYALDAVDAAAKALCDARGVYASNSMGLSASEFLWHCADAPFTDQRWIDEREELRRTVTLVAVSLAAFVAQGIASPRPEQDDGMAKDVG